MIRKATKKDLPSVTGIYTKILQMEETGNSRTGWKKDVYPTEQTARAAQDRDELFVMTSDGVVVAAARINQSQDPAYRSCDWAFDAPDDKVMVLHTLVVDPDASGKGYATKFMAFYESYARERGCLFLRMDTNEKNLAARGLYKKLGYREAGVVPCAFNGLEDVCLVCLEKSLAPAIRRG